MFELIVAALFQGIAGTNDAPGHPPPPALEEMSEGSSELAPPTAAPEQAQPVTVEPVAQPQTRRERRCVEVEISGRRLPRRECRMVEVPADDPASTPQ